MSAGFSTIKPMDLSTISKTPAYANNQQPQQQEAIASSPMEYYGQPPKEKSGWFLKTLATIVVLAAAVGLGRKFKPDTFNPDAILKENAKWYEKGLHYAKKSVGIAGQYVNKWYNSAYTAIVGLFDKSAKKTQKVS